MQMALISVEVTGKRNNKGIRLEITLEAFKSEVVNKTNKRQRRNSMSELM